MRYYNNVYIVQAYCGGLVAKFHALNDPESYMGAGSSPESPISYPAPSLWLGKAAEDDPKPWVPALT